MHEERHDVLQRAYECRSHIHRRGRKYDKLISRRMAEVSVLEDEENPYYSNVLDYVANDSVGKMPQIIVNGPNNNQNDSVEDRWTQWGSQAKIGEALRQIRRGACRTGIGIGIPYQSARSGYPHKLRIKTLCRLDLKTPHNGQAINAMTKRPVKVDSSKVFDGIQFDDNGEIERIYMEDEDGKFLMYKEEDILIFTKATCEGETLPMPECFAAFTIYPSIRRYLDAVLRRAEFDSAIPMFMKLDYQVYKPETDKAPKGSMEYRPGYIPTLPPGVSVEHINSAGIAADRTKMLRLMVSAAARCVSLPANLAFGDSSDSNMASAQVDRQTWENWIEIDRYDFAAVAHKLFNLWWIQARLIPNYFIGQAPETPIPYQFAPSTLFKHPDPSKVANANAVKLATGESTLTELLQGSGRNPRRLIEREAKFFNVDPQVILDRYLAYRVPANALEISEREEEED